MIIDRDCEHVRPLLSAYHDGETDAMTALAIKAHLDTCLMCSSKLSDTHGLSAALRGHVPYHRAPDALRRRLFENAEQRPTANRRPSKPSVGALLGLADIWPMRWALPMAAALMLAVGINTLQVSQRTQQALTDDVVTSHIRSLQGSHLDDIASSDHHTVKPWFAGKLDYSPPVFDLANEGYPLAGGRLDYLDGRPVAALDYRHRQHIINVFVWPAKDEQAKPPKAMQQSGYQIVRWAALGMNWWAVSDMNAADLTGFVRMLNTASEPKEGQAS